MLAGQLMTGGTAFTVTSKEQEAVLPEASVTLKVLVVVPMGKVVPLAWPAVWVVTAPEQLSVPTGTVYVTTVPLLPEARMLILAGQEMAGATLSSTVTVAVQDELLP